MSSAIVESMDLEKSPPTPPSPPFHLRTVKTTQLPARVDRTNEQLICTAAGSNGVLRVAEVGERRDGAVQESRMQRRDGKAWKHV